AASAYPWESGLFADLGVLTLPDVRGRGFARAVVLTISEFSRRKGYEPQYRCQIDNLASVALAKSCGFALFGKWIVASDVLDRT
ncbi:GNAT family N-acetyltransferase, partial [Clostridium perfringens]